MTTAFSHLGPGESLKREEAGALVLWWSFGWEKRRYLQKGDRKGQTERRLELWWPLDEKRRRYLPKWDRKGQRERRLELWWSLDERRMSSKGGQERSDVFQSGTGKVG